MRAVALHKSGEDPGKEQPGRDRLREQMPKIKLQKVGRRTAFVKRANDPRLNKTGSSGAQGYPAPVNFTFTENTGGKSVNMAGMYGRSSLADFKTVDEDGGRGR